jgi:predicted dehydrogenase
MAELLCSIESGLPANLNGNDNLKTMALVEAGYRSASEKRAVSISEIMDEPQPE